MKMTNGEREALIQEWVGRQGYGGRLFTRGDVEYHMQWQPASRSHRGWGVAREINPVRDCMIELEGKSGRRILFRSRESAQRRADELNKRDN